MRSCSISGMAALEGHCHRRSPGPFSPKIIQFLWGELRVAFFDVLADCTESILSRELGRAAVHLGQAQCCSVLGNVYATSDTSGAVRMINDRGRSGCRVVQ